MIPENQQPAYTSIPAEPAQAGVAKKFMANVFLWMFGALAVSALFAWLFATNLQLLSYLIDFERGTRTGLGTFVMFAPLLFVIIMSFGFNRLSATAMKVLFMAYAVLMGISLSFIMLIYTEGSLVSCFVGAASMFGIMAFMGYTTDKDLTSFGQIMMMGLIGIVIASLVNIFIGSSSLQWIVSLIGVAVFTGLTAYDVQKLKMIGEGYAAQGEDFVAVPAQKAAIYGALSLYLDFINLFLSLLRVFGSRR